MCRDEEEEEEKYLWRAGVSHIQHVVLREPGANETISGTWFSLSAGRRLLLN